MCRNDARRASDGATKRTRVAVDILSHARQIVAPWRRLLVDYLGDDVASVVCVPLAKPALKRAPVDA